MNKRIVVCLIFLLVVFSSSAQKYGSALGARIGNENYGLSYRQRILSKFTAEAMMTFQADAFQFTALPKYHLSVIGEATNLYFGAGAHLGQLKDYGAFYGFNALFGAEVKLPALPITVSADIMPTYHENHEDWFEFPAAVTVSIILAKETKEKRKKARKKRKKRKERRKRREERREQRKEWFQEHIFKNKSS
ncbi:hypothetical protein GCM10027429_27170 [Marivirga atlantica]|jgi:hypothetical protein|uniref:Uncharacterized protein n=1 Tax=Marivirga atlantica TaxID=1548457 RepID=A0A937AH17_9BACT|nr:hypothetical protein [Marivirga atlantica]MBL0766319.1 hypothetical protein [Marivirga atlantica]